SSPDGAALTFWFFWVKPKERILPIQRRETTVMVSRCQSVKIENGCINLGQKNVFLQAEQ
ncbi:MAG: hypothetical protein SOW30_08970, partial [Parabacteroides sp.]|nr:hypothetical protein [Parabacteroides sp.]